MRRQCSLADPLDDKMGRRACRGANLSNHEVPGEDEAQEVHEAGGGGQQSRIPGGNLIDEGVQQLRAAGHQAHRVNQHLHAGLFQNRAGSNVDSYS